jgi:hypothetical protein
VIQAERAAGAEGECSGGGGGGGGSHFALKDLWEFFDEWSAYGVEVPLLLDVEEHEVFQYYVPFLSGMQIFKATETDAGGGGGGGDSNVGRGEAGDGGGGGGGGKEGEKQAAAKEPRVSSSSAAAAATTAKGAAAAAKANGNVGGKKGLLSSGAAATKTGEEVPGRELVFQFMEQASPYSRAPLSDTLTTLVGLSLHSRVSDWCYVDHTECP